MKQVMRSGACSPMKGVELVEVRAAISAPDVPGVQGEARFWLAVVGHPVEEHQEDDVQGDVFERQGITVGPPPPPPQETPRSTESTNVWLLAFFASFPRIVRVWHRGMSLLFGEAPCIFPKKASKAQEELQYTSTICASMHLPFVLRYCFCFWTPTR